jgi:hypothetical protein
VQARGGERRKEEKDMKTKGKSEDGVWVFSGNTRKAGSKLER